MTNTGILGVQIPHYEIYPYGCGTLGYYTSQSEDDDTLWDSNEDTLVSYNDTHFQCDPSQASEAQVAQRFFGMGSQREMFECTFIDCSLENDLGSLAFGIDSNGQIIWLVQRDFTTFQ